MKDRLAAYSLPNRLVKLTQHGFAFLFPPLRSGAAYLGRQMALGSSVLVQEAHMHTSLILVSLKILVSRQRGCVAGVVVTV